MTTTASLEFTPNPETLKYVISRPLLERGALEYRSLAEADHSPLAQALFALDGVDAVMIAKDFVTVTVQDAAKMPSVNAAVLAAIPAHLDAGHPVYTGPELGSEHGEASSEAEKKIIEILDQQIRPAVAMDGGDIVFDRFESGIVYLQLKGSCAGCPSSMATLKHGVEGRLKQMVPEVVSVEAVALAN